MTKSIAAAGAFILLVLSPACTNLTEVPSSAITPGNFYRNEGEVIGGLASAYAQLRATVWSYYNLEEISSDEMIVPTRGSDWYDNGTWLDVHRQTFTPNSPAGLDNINGAWGDLFQGVARVNVVLAGIQNVTFASKPVVVAELRTLRAFYYYLLMDLFGGVPIVTDVEIKPRTQNTRAEVFSFVETELKAALPDLPATWPPEMNGRLTKGAANAILASLCLNAVVFTGTVSATGLQGGTAHWQDAINAADAIINSGNYLLATDANIGCPKTGCGWRHNFTADNSASPEIIMAVKFIAVPGLGLNFIQRALHYSQFTPSPWNGFATLAETYFAFDSSDIRRQIFLAGLQFNVETGLPVTDRQGNPLVFTPNIGDATAASEGAGVRIMKWPPDPNHVDADNGNDYAYFRLGEIYLIKAEAMNELGQTPQAAVLINTTTRSRAFPSKPKPLSPGLSQAQMRDSILGERLLELTAEAKRRTDLIRMGKYNLPWGYKLASPPYKILMPIPQTQIETNPLLKQNPGY